MSCGVLLGGLLGQELLFLLETLDHLVNHYSHACQACLWIQEALDAPVRNKLVSEVLLQEYCNTKFLQYGHPDYGYCDSRVVEFVKLLSHPQVLCSTVKIQR